MMLPEHREALLADNRSLKELEMPELDEQEVTLINQAIMQSLQTKCQLIITLFGKYEYETITGSVLMFASKLNQVKITLFDPFAEEPECVWVTIRDIVKD